ncbi:ModD protein [Sutterella sp.]|uniref:ModD protein n=1 Tax=Sutterella sp. TaxID=1981025 RepID=UPI0026DF8414|nr:ModD protein [Sutterella sp.]MDO5531527.1 ModD protein [Sutterella sp.]
MLLNSTEIDSILFSDCPYEDLTTEGLGIGEARGRITAKLKAEGVAAGLEIAAALFERAGARAELLAREGDVLPAGTPVMIIEGRAKALHAAYKMAQCVMEYAGGIAGRTRMMVEAARAERPEVQVAGTRKHWPGGKRIALAGLLAGGGIVHRLGLSDSILVFDQHRVFASDFDAAFRALRLRSPERKIAVEAGDPAEAMHFLELGADIVQCERFAPEVFEAFAREARAAAPGAVLTVAGGVNAENAAAYARAGADILITSWPYWARPADVKMAFESLEGGNGD